MRILSCLKNLILNHRIGYNEMNKGDVVEAVFIMENFTRKCKNYNNTCLIELFCNECPFNGINSH